MMEPVKREMRLICVHAPPVSEEWIHYIEYMGGLLGAELVYRHTLGRAGVLSAAAGEKDVILLQEPASARLQLALGRTMSERLAGRGPASVLVVHRPRWPLGNILLIFRAELGDEAAIEWTRALARRSGAAVTVLPILPPIPALYTWRRDGRLDAGQLLASNTPAAARLRRLLGQFDQEQTPASVHLGPGEPLWQMRDEMADHDYDLAIAGAEPAGRLHRFLVGDLLGPLLHSANCPVFVARNAPELGLAGTIQPSRSVPALQPARAWRTMLRRLGKVTLFLVSLFLFILAITLMKEGARELGPLVREHFRVSNAANSLGFGWLFAYGVMSGSPVAAAALTFFDAGIIDGLGTFAMITGSRLGASFIVLFIGFIYVLRGRNRSTSLSMGLLSLIVTGTTYLAGLVVGILLLNSGWLDGAQLESGAFLNSATDLIFDPAADFFLSFLPRWSLFLVGLAIIILSFNLFDKCLPQMSLKESQLGRMSRLVYRPWVMFLLGAAVTLISMSVSVSLSLLVPLSQRGFVRRENVIPYIMGANITTFVDTLLAAVLLNNPPAFTVVLVEMLSIAIVSIFTLGLIYDWYHEMMLGTVDWIVEDSRHLALFMLTILVVPVLLLLL